MRGVPLVAHVTAANVNDITDLGTLVADLPAVRRSGRTRRRPDVLQGDRGYNSQPHRDRIAARVIVAIFRRRRTSHGSGLGVFRWVVERTLSWLHRFRRLAVRYERQDRPSRLPHAGVRADLLELPKVNWESVLKRALMLLMIKSDTGSPPCRPSRHRATRRSRQGTRNSNGKRGVPVSASHAGKVYRRRFVATRLAATLLADGAPCFVICACPALVIKRDCSYISIHFSLATAEISLPIASSGKSSGDSK